MQTSAADAEILLAACRNHDVDPFLPPALKALADGCGADYLALYEMRSGSWVLRSAHGNTSLAPPRATERVAEALDIEQTISRDDWAAVPLECRSEFAQVLLLHARDGRGAAAGEALAAHIPLFREAFGAVRARHAERVRLARLEAMLEIAGRWSQAQDMESLLRQMAEAAARLLDADRASIFLWDRAAHQLVGRPALGVADGELRVPDDAGIVGQVLRAREPRRWGRHDDHAAINQRVGAALGYSTKSLLCVPLSGRQGECFGVFEAINKRDGDFTVDDVTALEELAAHAAIALENTQEREDLLATRQQITDEAASSVRLIGESPAIVALRSTTTRVAATDLAVLVLGENGTGKEVVSKSIHYQSPRRTHPFIAVNCAALSETLLESELFGHEQGAFTDAREMHRGKFELASGGTLFLDEIGDLSLAGQSKLLRALEEKIVVRVGGSLEIHTDARVIAATNQDLAEMVRQKRFREDLYFRLNVVTLSLPPLRERADDILLLAEAFLKDFARKARRKAPHLSAAAQQRLRAHPWPGNVRELRNLMERLAYLSVAETIEAEDLAFILSPSARTTTLVSPELQLAEATDRFQSQHIAQALRRADGNMSEAAEMLGMHRSNLYRKMRQLGLEATE